MFPADRQRSQACKNSTNFVTAYSSGHGNGTRVVSKTRINNGAEEGGNGGRRVAQGAYSGYHEVVVGGGGASEGWAGALTSSRGGRTGRRVAGSARSSS